MGKGWLCWASMGLSLAAIAVVGLHILLWHGGHGWHRPVQHRAMRLAPHEREFSGGAIKVTPIVPRELRFYPGRQQWEIIPWRGNEGHMPFMRPGECPPAGMMILPNPTTYAK